MYDGPSVAMGASVKSGPKQLTEIRIRKLDDGSFTLRAEYCGRNKEGMMSYESLESSYKNVDALAGSLKNLLKPNMASREKTQDANLKSRD